jgi:hypothetical protein
LDVEQKTELERVKARIKALTEKTVANGCTEAEALAAAEMVGRLLERYALSMAEIEVRTTGCVQVEVPLAGRRRRPIDSALPAIARFCDCKVWRAHAAEGGSYVFFGFPADAALARYLYAVVEHAMQGELALFRHRSPWLAGVGLRRASASFQHGMAVRVSERLEAMRAEREVAVAAGRSDGRALMVVKQAAVAEAFRAAKVRLVAGRAQMVRLDGAFREGRLAGERVNLNRPLPAEGRARLR